MDGLIGGAGKGDPLVQLVLHSVYGFSYTLDTLTLFTLDIIQYAHYAYYGHYGHSMDTYCTFHSSELHCNLTKLEDFSGLQSKGQSDKVSGRYARPKSPSTQIVKLASSKMCNNALHKVVPFVPKHLQLYAGVFKIGF